MLRVNYSPTGLNSLESFHRQYVSLLLIVLVFSTIGIRDLQSSKTSDSQNVSARAPLTNIELDNPFSEEGLSPSAQETLRAAHEVLLSHDVSLFITLNMPMQRYGNNRIESAKALRYLLLIGQEFADQPAGIVTYSLAESERRNAVLGLRFVMEKETDA